MIKIDIISGFLGAGKTTFIKKLIDCYKDEQLVLIENEFGDIGIDGQFLKDANIEMTELNSGCICCSLAGDFNTAIKQIIDTYHPDRILIEPTGVAKLSDVYVALQGIDEQYDIVLDSATTIIDVLKFDMYFKNFGEFYINQIENANNIVLSHLENQSSDRIKTILDQIKEHNVNANVMTAPWQEMSNEKIIKFLETKNDLNQFIQEAIHEDHHHHHDEDEGCSCGHHHHHDEDEECSCGHRHHHDDDEECSCGHHHHHDEDEECSCGHHHHHDDDEECSCGHHHHHDEDEECSCGHHHHHDEDEECSCGHHHHHDEPFTSWSKQTTASYTHDELTEILEKLTNDPHILRVKGLVPSDDHKWYYFDANYQEFDIYEGDPDYTGKIVVIGDQVNEEELESWFK